MEDLFELMTIAIKDRDGPSEVRLGIRLNIAGLESLCPISKSCRSYEALEMELQAIERNLQEILGKAKGIFTEPGQEGLGLRSDMEAEHIWSILKDVADERLFVESFNGLDEPKRKEVASSL